MSICSHEGCACQAVWQVNLNIWPGATPRACRDEYNCYVIVTNIIVCEFHKDVPKPDNLFTEEGLLGVGNFLAGFGISGLDFSDMEVELDELVDGKPSFTAPALN